MTYGIKLKYATLPVYTYIKLTQQYWHQTINIYIYINYYIYSMTFTHWKIGSLGYFTGHLTFYTHNPPC